MTPELTSEAPRVEPSAPSPGDAEFGDQVARFHLRISLVFLAVGSLLFAVAAAKLVFPDALSSVSVLAYGRLAPAAFNLIAYGWLTIGLIGAGYYILPRVSGKPLRHRKLAVFGGALIAVGVLQGAVAVLLGANEGRQYLEFPIWSDAVILIGLLATVRVVTGTIAGKSDRPLAPTEWFYGSAPVWLLLSHIVGNIPGLTGVNSTLQTTFYRGALFGLWFAAASLGVVYYLVSEVSGRDPRRITQLAVIGFWSLGFAFALSSGSRLTYTSAPDWLETLGGVFSIALFLPVAIILVDLAATLRGGRAASGRATLRFVIAGAVAFAVVPVVNLALSLRSASSVVGLTDWVVALDVLVVFGAFSFWLFAFVHHAFVPSGRGAGHYRLTVVAVLAAVGAFLVSGVQTGLGWVAAANAGEVSAGEGFETTVGAIDGQLWVRFIAFSLFALAQLVLVAAAWSGRREPGGAEEDAFADAADDLQTAAEDEEEEELPGGLPAGVPVTLGRVRTGTIGVFVLVVVFAFGFPALEKEHVTATALADGVRNYDAEDFVERGRSVYLAEGCWYCHTQEVRGIVTDVGLGPVAVPGDYAHETPSTAGVMRGGPDLMFAGTRDPTRDREWVGVFLADPRSVRAWSTMPAHDYLGATDLEAVATYVASLRQNEFE